MTIIWIILLWYVLGLFGTGMNIVALNHGNHKSNYEKSLIHFILAWAGPIMILVAFEFYYMSEKKEQGMESCWVWNKWW